MKMIINLFSVFDPSSSLGWSLNLVSRSVGLILYPFSKWRVPSRILRIVRLMALTLYNEIKQLLSNKSKRTRVIFISLFIFILVNNLIGLPPYVFTSTRHLATTLRLALPLWIGYFFYGWITNTKWILAHLIPQGTPALLMPFIVIIERVSGIIRPATLAVRLIANMIAGHLLLALVRGAAPVLAFGGLIRVVIAQILLVILEVAVAAIQAYVLVVLRVLYTSEV